MIILGHFFTEKRTNQRFKTLLINYLTFFNKWGGRCNYSAKEPICRNGSPLSDESKDGIKRGLSVFPCRVGNGMESVEGIGAGIGTEAT